MKLKKMYVGILIFFLIFLCMGFLTLGKKDEKENITYENFKEYQSDMMKKDDYKTTDLENKIQDSIQQVVEGSNPVVSINNYNSTDNTDTTVSVTFNSNYENGISMEQRETIENLLLKYFNGIMRENIIINVENAEK